MRRQLPRGLGVVTLVRGPAEEEAEARGPAKERVNEDDASITITEKIDTFDCRKSYHLKLVDKRNKTP
jgi:hypothetical protein